MCALQNLLRERLLGNAELVLGEMYRFRFRIVHNVSYVLLILNYIHRDFEEVTPV